MANSPEVERTEALLGDAIQMLREPATSYSKAAAAAVVMEALRLYRRALQAQASARRAPEAERALRGAYP